MLVPFPNPLDMPKFDGLLFFEDGTRTGRVVTIPNPGARHVKVLVYRHKDIDDGCTGGHVPTYLGNGEAVYRLINAGKVPVLVYDRRWVLGKPVWSRATLQPRNVVDLATGQVGWENSRGVGRSDFPTFGPHESPWPLLRTWVEGILGELVGARLTGSLRPRLWEADREQWDAQQRGKGLRVL